MPEGDPEHHPRGHGPRRRRRPGDAPEPVAVRALLRRPRAVDGARPRLQRLRRRAVHAVLRPASRRPRPSRSPTSTTRSPRSSASPPPGFRADPAAGDAAAAVLLARPRPGVGGGAGQRRARVHPHADRRREGQRPDVDDAQGRHGAGRAGQPADDREVGVEADDHAVRLQPDRPAAGHVRADRRRRRRALPRPALRADRVQRALAGVAGRRAWTSAGSPASARTPTGGSASGTTPARRRPAQHGAAVPPQREVAVPADAERVRAAPVPRVVPGRPGGRRVPAHHRLVDASCGATTTRTPKARSAAAGS